MAIIQVTNLSFGYEGSFQNVFDNVSFQMDTDWKLGFVGRNGRGKTTFLKLLLGEYPYQGKISTNTKFEYFPFTFANSQSTTVDLIRSLSPEASTWQIEMETSLLDLQANALERPFNTLSNGEQTKALIASLFLRENRFLLIDEPTNHLDMEGRKVVSEYLNKKKGFILVSHDRSFLDACVDHILSINKANIEVQKGNFSNWWQNKLLQDQFELREDEKLRQELRRLTIASRRNAAWSDTVEKSKLKRFNSSDGMIDKGAIGHKAAKMMARSKAIETRSETQIEAQSKLLKNLEDKETLKLFPLEFHSKILLDLEDVGLRYGEKWVFNGVRLQVKAGERIALQGKNGSGKSSLLKLILGEVVEYTGQVNRNQQLIISYVPQDTSGLKGSLNQFMQAHQLNEKQFKIVLSQLEIPHTQFDLPMETFSLGQKKKIALARSMCEKAHLYLWDEPLNYIDVISRIQIETLLLEYKPSIIFVEHDQAFINKVATQKFLLNGAQSRFILN